MYLSCTCEEVCSEVNWRQNWAVFWTRSPGLDLVLHHVIPGVSLVSGESVDSGLSEYFGVKIKDQVWNEFVVVRRRFHSGIDFFCFWHSTEQSPFQNVNFYKRLLRVCDACRTWGSTDRPDSLSACEACWIWSPNVCKRNRPVKHLSQFSSKLLTLKWFFPSGGEIHWIPETVWISASWPFFLFVLSPQENDLRWATFVQVNEVS